MVADLAGIRHCCQTFDVTAIADGLVYSHCWAVYIPFAFATWACGSQGIGLFRWRLVATIGGWSFLGAGDFCPGYCTDARPDAGKKKAVGLGFPCWTTSRLNGWKTKAYSLDGISWVQHSIGVFYHSTGQTIMAEYVKARIYSGSSI